MPLVIGFAGQARCGKDTASDYLCESLNESGMLGPWKRASLGFNVKKIFAEHFGVTLEFIEEWKVKDYPPEGFDGPIRMGLTQIGDGWRNTKSDIWINKLFAKNHQNLIISDIRYINEAKACRGESNLDYMSGYNGVTCLCWRPGFENNKQSRSEQELMPFVRELMDRDSGPIDNPEIPFDLWLKNDSTKDAWLRLVDDLVIPYTFEKFAGVTLS